MDDGVDARARFLTGVGIGDVEADDLVLRTRGIGKRIDIDIGQAEAITLAMRLPECGSDATGGAGKQHEAALGLTHAGGTQKRVVLVERSRVTDPDFDRRSCSAPALTDLPGNVPRLLFQRRGRAIPLLDGFRIN